MNIINSAWKATMIANFFIIAVSGLFLSSVALAKAPTVYITAPAPDSIVSGEITIVARASSNTSITQVEFFIDGNSKGKGVAELDGNWSIWSIQWITPEDEERHVIEARATDTRGKTTADSIEVIANNPNVNTKPVAAFHYNWDGLKYYFYPNESYDPDGYIVRYDVKIFQILSDNSNREIDSYSCCEVSACGDELCSEKCQDPDPDSGFCLFFTCPYICYEFAGPGTYSVQLEVWDNEGVSSDIVKETIDINSSANENDMYVWRINPQIKITGSGATLNLMVFIKHDLDSNGDSNGQSEQDDLPASGVLVEMKLSKDEDSIPDGSFGKEDSHFNAPTYSGTTNRDGKVIFSARGLSPGDYRAEVTLPYDPNNIYVWRHDLDIWNPRDITLWNY